MSTTTTTSSSSSSSSNDIVRFDVEDCLVDELFEIKKIREEEEEKEEELERASSVFSIDFRGINTFNRLKIKDDVVCVCVDFTKKDNKNLCKSSLDALSWTLQHWITPSSTLCLLHVFPFVRLIPSEIGYLERIRVNKLYVDYHLDNVKDEKKLRLRKFVDPRTASQVKVEATPIEADKSNNVANAIVDYVRNHEIRKLVIGATKSKIRRNGIGYEVVKNMTCEKCEVKVICKGSDVSLQLNDEMIGSSGSISSNSSTFSDHSPRSIPKSSSRENESRGSSSLKRFFERIQVYSYVVGV